MEISINTKEQFTLFDHRLRYLLKIYHFLSNICVHTAIRLENINILYFYTFFLFYKTGKIHIICY